MPKIKNALVKQVITGDDYVLFIITEKLVQEKF
jgi:hypothetical protein